MFPQQGLTNRIWGSDQQARQALKVVKAKSLTLKAGSARSALPVSPVIWKLGSGQWTGQAFKTVKSKILALKT